MTVETDLKLWVLGGTLALAVPSLAYLLVREFSRKDRTEDSVKSLAERVTDSVDELNKGVAALTLAIEEIRVWSHERFVTRPEFKDLMEGVRSDIQAHAHRFERELDRCSESCPYRKGGE